MGSRTSTLTNAVPLLILSGPGHRLMSRRYAVLHFTGRRTGRRYRVPVAYRWSDEAIVISTDSGWWVNLLGGRRFSVRLAGRRHTATARRITGTAAAQALADLVTIPGYSRAAGIRRERGQVTSAELNRAAAARYVLRLTFDDADEKVT